MLTEGLKTGAQHTESLRDARKIYLDGALVDDVTVHPAYRNAVGSVAALYDFQSAPENVDLMTFAVPGSGGARAEWPVAPAVGVTPDERCAVCHARVGPRDVFCPECGATL